MDEKSWSRGRAFFYSLFLCLMGVVLLGIVLDQVTIRMAPEFFTVYRPRLIASDDLTMTALAWSFAGRWWMAIALGGYLGLVAIAGELPAASKQELAAAILTVVGGTALAVVLMGIRGMHREPTSPNFSVGDNVALTRVQILHITSLLSTIPLAIVMSLWMISRRYKNNLDRLRAQRS